MSAEQKKQRQIDEDDTVDIEEDTEDVVDEVDAKSKEPTEPELSSPRKPHRIRMPSKAEVAAAVESVGTESLDVDDVVRESARAKTEDLD